MYSRWQFALAWDETSTRAAAARPEADALFGFPMTPDEEAAWFAWQAVTDRLAVALGRYGQAHRDEFGGLFIDQRERRVATLWTGDLDGHEAAMRDLVGTDAPLVLYAVRYPEADLRGLQDHFPFDDPIFAEVAADLTGVGVDIRRNVLSLDVSSANPDAPRRIVEAIAARLGVTSDQVVVDSDGTGVTLIPWGTVRGVLYLPDGERLRGQLELDVFGGGDELGSCGSGDVGFGVGPDGKFEIPCQEGSRTILISEHRADGPQTIGSAEVVVRAGETTSVRINLILAPEHR